MTGQYDLDFDLDLGDEHYLKYTEWAPDRALNPHLADLPDIKRVGAIIRHRKPDGDWCESAILFSNEVTERLGGGPRWTVHTWEPLTVSPSLLCVCGDHGFIRDGKWLKA